jgi:hypothetical protein
MERGTFGEDIILCVVAHLPKQDRRQILQCFSLQDTKEKQNKQLNAGVISLRRAILFSGGILWIFNANRLNGFQYAQS